MPFGFEVDLLQGRIQSIAKLFLTPVVFENKPRFSVMLLDRVRKNYLNRLAMLPLFICKFQF